MTSEIPSQARELHSRGSAGLHVSLLWRESDGELFVSVIDDRTGETFSVDVPDRERALDVFNHPYAYAP